MNRTDYLQAAEMHCERRGCKLTALRRQVLELVLRHQGVVKAYQVLADLQKERGIAAPPTVYRALDFLVEQGLLHRVDALNGFVVCDHFECQHESMILVYVKPAARCRKST
jgi:Fur family zinc uptake transcriptional regulator